MISDIAPSIINQAFHAVFSPQPLLLAAAALLLRRHDLPEKAYNVLLYLAAFAYLFLFQGKFLQIFTMAGDNICQIAYWKILFHPDLAGSIGASYTKPGQLLILGPLYELSGIFGENVFRIGICLVMAGCLWILARIATDIGDREAGLLAFLAAFWTFLPEFLAGSYSIFLVPTLYAGLWLYFFNPGKKTLGRLLLVLSIQFHIQVITVLAVVWLMLLIKKERKELVLFSTAAAASVAAWAGIILRVQGTIDRLNSGAAAGYVAPFGETFAYQGTADYLVKAVTFELTNNVTACLLLVLAATGIIATRYHRQTAYLSVFSVAATMVANVVLLGGTINLGRYFSVIYAFGCSVGIATLVMIAARINRRLPSLLAGVALIPFAIVMHSSETNTDRHLRQPPDYVTSATALLADPNLPSHSRLMTEDDLLYPVVALSPSRYKSLTALQYFNVAPPAKRKRILYRTDHIWVATNHRHPYYYLDHLPLPQWREDDFRLMLHGILNDNQPRTLYGFRFIPVANDAERLLLMVKPDIM